MSVKHWFHNCSTAAEWIDEVASDWPGVTCRGCLVTYTTNNPGLPDFHPAHARLTELDRAQGQHVTINQVIDPCDDPDYVVRKTREALESMVKKGATVTVNVNANTPDIKKAIDDKLQPLLTLLTRCSDFIAALPSGALDRNRNVEAMNLRRAIANIVCPANEADKKGAK